MFVPIYSTERVVRDQLGQAARGTHEALARLSTADMEAIDEVAPAQLANMIRDRLTQGQSIVGTAANVLHRTDSNSTRSTAEILRYLRDNGYHWEQSVEALEQTGFRGTRAAMEWIREHTQQEDEDSDECEHECQVCACEVELEDLPLQMMPVCRHMFHRDTCWKPFLEMKLAEEGQSVDLVTAPNRSLSILVVHSL